MHKTLIVISIIGFFTVLYLTLHSSNLTQTEISENTALQVSTKNTVTTASISSQSGLIAYISPETGKLTTQAAASNLRTAANPRATVSVAQQTNQDPEAKELPPIKFTTYRDGMVRADLNGHFMVPQTATIDCNGQLRTTHDDHPEVSTHCVND